MALDDVTRARVDDDATEAWYVYAVLRRVDGAGLGLEDVPGVDGRPVRLIAEGDLAAIAGFVPLQGFRAVGDEPEVSEESWLARSVRAHERVVEHAFAHCAVLPFRFGTLYPTAADVLRVLREGRRTLTAELCRLDGRSEWGVRAYLDQPDGQGADGQEPGAGAQDRPRSGTEWMLRRRDAAADRAEARGRSERIATEVHGALSRRAHDSALRRPEQPRMTGRLVLDGAYLVDRDAEQWLTAVLDDLAGRHAEHGLRFELTGPWPPYHFLRLPERIGDG